MTRLCQADMTKINELRKTLVNRVNPTKAVYWSGSLSGRLVPASYCPETNKWVVIDVDRCRIAVARPKDIEDVGVRCVYPERYFDSTL